MILVFDTETTGFSPVKNEIVQLSYILYDTQRQTVIYATQQGDDIVNINGKIPKQTSNIHGITKDMTIGKRPIKEHIDQFIHYFNQADKFVGHNISFDIKMIVGQIDKIIQSFPQEEERYNEFLNKFRMVGKDLPDAAFCTMEESKGICAQIRGTNKLKKEKLMEVHKLLFNQDVGGQLHNALVDISVTLRVFLKLTMDIDICQSMRDFNRDIQNVKNNNEICSLIYPINIGEPIESVDYTGELITGFTILSDNALEEQKIMVQTIARKLATKIVTDIQKQAMTNVLNKVIPSETMCTSITICRSIFKSGARKGEVCGKPAKYNEFCNYHKPKGNKNLQEIHPLVTPSVLDEQIVVQQKMKSQTKAASNYINNLIQNFTRKNNKVAPLGGKRKIIRGKIKNKRTIKKNVKVCGNKV